MFYWSRFFHWSHLKSFEVLLCFILKRIFTQTMSVQTFTCMYFAGSAENKWFTVNSTHDLHIIDTLLHQKRDSWFCHPECSSSPLVPSFDWQRNCVWYLGLDWAVHVWCCSGIETVTVLCSVLLWVLSRLLLFIVNKAQSVFSKRTETCLLFQTCEDSQLLSVATPWQPAENTSLLLLFWVSWTHDDTW